MAVVPFLVAAAAVAAGATLQSATGFGFSLVAAPLVFAAMGPEEAVGLLTLLGAQVSLMTLATEGRRPQPAMSECALVLAAAVPGAVAGVAVLRALDVVALQIAVSLGVIGTLAVRRLATGHLPRWAGVPAGFASGALTTSTTTSGPPLLVFLLGRQLTPDQMRDTLPVCFLGLSVIGALALWTTGTTAAIPEPWQIAVLVPVAAAGQLLGRRLFARLARSGRFEPVVTGVLLASVLGGLAAAAL
ncbi:MAG TPA: TSUP family transporter [Solirubrobacteraceae bacterium]|nr:TSUP family transporter [Solirubrobacteraceae bacterium]